MYLCLRASAASVIEAGRLFRTKTHRSVGEKKTWRHKTVSLPQLTSAAAAAARKLQY